MKTTQRTTIATVALSACFGLAFESGTTSAQTITYTPHGPVVRRHANVVVPQFPVGRIEGSSRGRYLGTTHSRFPVIVTPDTITGINSQTGGFDTGNLQVDNTFFDAGRNQSRFNGTERWVQRPIHDQFGNVIGYQEGFVWNNSRTGVEHGDLTNHVPNGNAGIHSQTQLRSARPSTGRTRGTTGVHTQRQFYGASPRR